MCYSNLISKCLSRYIILHTILQNMFHAPVVYEERRPCLGRHQSQLSLCLTAIPGENSGRLPDANHGVFLEYISGHVKEENSQNGYTIGKSCLTDMIAICDMTESVNEGTAVHVIYHVNKAVSCNIHLFLY